MNLARDRVNDRPLKLFSFTEDPSTVDITLEVVDSGGVRVQEHIIIYIGGIPLL